MEGDAEPPVWEYAAGQETALPRQTHFYGRGEKGEPTSRRQIHDKKSTENLLKSASSSVAVGVERSERKKW